MSEDDAGVLPDEGEVDLEEQPAIYAVKTAIGHEKDVADQLAGRARRKGVQIVAILSPIKLRGYIIVEGKNLDAIKELLKGITHARGFVDGTAQVDELEIFLKPKPLVAGISEGDIVEIISGPFKGEKARVQHIDEGKEEITVELFEAMVPIPVTIKGNSVRVLDRDTI